MYEVFSSGGGTQSACISALIVQGRLPKPDFMVIADTGYECQSTWAYLDAVIRPAMASVGVEVHRIGPEWQSVPEHGMEFMSHNGNTMIIPVWSNLNGSKGKLSGFCSARWKVEVVNRFLSQQFGITRSKFRKWIGFSLDEWRRAQSIMVSEEGRKGLIHLPLVTEVPLKRHQSIREVERMGWPTPPRSRCKICPNQQDDEWNELTPEELQAAVEYEARIQAVDPHAYLHQSCTPLAQVDFSPAPSLFDSGNYCSSGVCFV